MEDVPLSDAQVYRLVLAGPSISLQKAESTLRELSDTRVERNLPIGLILKRKLMQENALPHYPTMPERLMRTTTDIFSDPLNKRGLRKDAAAAKEEDGGNARQAATAWPPQPLAKQSTVEQLRATLVSNLESYDWRRDGGWDLPLACKEYYSDLSINRLKRIQAGVTQRYMSLAEALLSKYAREEAQSNADGIFSPGINASRAIARLLSDMNRKHSFLRIGGILTDEVKAMMDRDGVLPPAMAMAEARRRQAAVGSRIDSGMKKGAGSPVAGVGEDEGEGDASPPSPSASPSAPAPATAPGSRVHTPLTKTRGWQRHPDQPRSTRWPRGQQAPRYTRWFF
jgi:hypothetical protein